MTPGTFYAVRQARTRVIGSPVMTQAQADREVAAWTDPDHGMGKAARVVPATPALRRAVRCYDQVVLAEALYGATAQTEGTPR